MEIVICPDPHCAVPAEVLDRWSWPSSDGPVEHVRTRCVLGHLFTVPLDGAWVTYAEPRAAEPRAAEPRAVQTGAAEPDGSGLRRRGERDAA